LRKYFNNISFEEICRFFDIEVPSEEKIKEKIMGKETIKEDCEERIDALRILYEKLLKYNL